MSEYTKNTGVMPVAKGTLVDVIFRDGTFAKNVPAGVYISYGEAIAANPENNGYAEDWSIDGVQFDIIEWRLTEG